MTSFNNIFLYISYVFVIKHVASESEFEFVNENMTELEDFVDSSIKVIPLNELPETENEESTRVEPIKLSRYNSFSAFNNFLRQIESLYPDIAKLEKIGKSFEGRSIYMIKLSEGGEKPIIFVDANIHAREWATGATALYLIKKIVTDPLMLTCVDWYIIPMMNPDGYEYSRNHDRMWRKNRSRSNSSVCLGVDLNRNFPLHWNEAGVSQDRCNKEIYSGPEPLSEPESQALSRTLSKYAENIKLYLSLHSYGNMILYPFGYGKDLPPQWKTLKEFGAKMSKVIWMNSRVFYSVQQSSQLYPAAGGSDDYALGILNISLAYTIEMSKGFGFEYPERALPLLYKQIMPAFISAKNMIGQNEGCA